MPALILVVDDEPSIADTLTAILRMTGYAATAAYCGEEALAKISIQTPALVVTDVIMPGLDGVSLAKQIRRSHPECPILLFSGNAGTQDLLEQARREGYNFEVMGKPVPPPQMLTKVNSLLASA